MKDLNNTVKVTETHYGYIGISMEIDGEENHYFVAPGHYVESWGNKGRGVADMMALREGRIQNPRSKFGECDVPAESHAHETVLAEFIDDKLVLYPDRMTSGSRAYFFSDRLKWNVKDDAN